MKIYLYVFFIFLSIKTFACDCEKPSFQAAFDSANLVFVGKATEVTTNWISGGWKATFVVEESWKMPTEGFLIVNTPWEKDCGFRFEVGKEYLIYAKKVFTTKTNVCMGTKPLSEAAADIQALGLGTKPASKGNANFMIGIMMVLGVLSVLFLIYVVLHGRKQKHKPVG